MAVLLGAVRKPKNYSIDNELVDDLFLFMQNEQSIMRNYERSFLPNIATKVGQGKLDKNKLPKLFEYLYKNHYPTIVKYYAKVKLNPAEREALGKLWADQAIEDLKYNYDQLYSGRTNKYEPLDKFTKGKSIGRVML
jgi:hypothetical protein